MADKKDDASKANPAASRSPAASGSPAASDSQAASGSSGSYAQTSTGSSQPKPGDAKPTDNKASDPKFGDMKRPQAIVEGKAVEIASTTIRPDLSKPDLSKPDAAKPEPSKSDGTKASVSPGSATPPLSASDPLKSGGKPADTKPTPAKAETVKVGTSPPPKSTPAAPLRPSSGLGSMFSHLIAGVIGGAAAWYGISTIGPELGKQYGIAMPAPHASELRVIQEELAKLKKVTAAAPSSAPASAASPEQTAKLAAAEAEIKKLQETAKSVALLDAGQAKVAADIKALSQAQARQADAEARVTKLEDRLKIMSEATGADTGKLPQLAAVTGRLVDLETTMTNQLSALRKTVSQELENRLATTDENSNAAKSGTNRVDRELSAVKSQASTLVERMDTIKAESDRLANGVATLREETGTLKTAVETVRSDLDAKYKTTVKPNDVASAIAPIAGKLGAIEQNLAAVVKSEDDRKSNAERIVLSLELNNLKRVIDRGQKFGKELAEVAKIAGSKVDLSVLERHKDKGLPSLAELTGEFPSVANAILDAQTAAPAEGNMFDRVMASAKSVVRIRKTDYDASDKSPEAVIGRMERALKDGRVADAAAEGRTLPSKAAAAGQAFLLKLESRAAVDTAIASLETSLKFSLAGKPTN